MVTFTQDRPASAGKLTPGTDRSGTHLNQSGFSSRADLRSQTQYERSEYPKLVKPEAQKRLDNNDTSWIRAADSPHLERLEQYLKENPDMIVHFIQGSGPSEGLFYGETRKGPTRLESLQESLQEYQDSIEAHRATIEELRKVGGTKSRRDIRKHARLLTSKINAARKVARRIRTLDRPNSTDTRYERNAKNQQLKRTQDLVDRGIIQVEYPSFVEGGSISLSRYLQNPFVPTNVKKAITKEKREKIEAKIQEKEGPKIDPQKNLETMMKGRQPGLYAKRRAAQTMRAIDRMDDTANFTNPVRDHNDKVVGFNGYDSRKVQAQVAEITQRRKTATPTTDPKLTTKPIAATNNVAPERIVRTKPIATANNVTSERTVHTNPVAEPTTSQSLQIPEAQQVVNVKAINQQKVQFFQKLDQLLYQSSGGYVGAIRNGEISYREAGQKLREAHTLILRQKSNASNTLTDTDLKDAERKLKAAFGVLSSYGADLLIQKKNFAAVNTFIKQQEDRILAGKLAISRAELYYIKKRLAESQETKQAANLSTLSTPGMDSEPTVQAKVTPRTTTPEQKQALDQVVVDFGGSHEYYIRVHQINRAHKNVDEVVYLKGVNNFHSPDGTFSLHRLPNNNFEVRYYAEGTWDTFGKALNVRPALSRTKKTV